MKTPNNGVELVFHLDEFLWEEEVLELTGGIEFYRTATLSADSSDSVVVVEHVLNRLTNSVDLRNAYPFLLALEYAVFGLSADIVSAQDLADRIQGSLHPWFESGQLFRVVAYHMGRLMNFASSNQTALARYDSSNCLMRQVSKARQDPAPISAQLRLCLNILFVYVIVNRDRNDLLSQVEDSTIHQSLLTALRLHTDSVVPTRKVVAMLFKLFSLYSTDCEIYLGSNTCLINGSQSRSTDDLSFSASPMSTLVHCIPFLSIPVLSDFRAFAALAMHQDNLINWIPMTSGTVVPRPSAIDEGIALIDKYLLEFISKYRFHEAELEFIKSHASLTRVMMLYAQAAESGRLMKPRTNLLKKYSSSQTETSRFSISEIARSMIANYHLVGDAGPRSVAGDPETSCDEEDAESLPCLPLVHEAFQSCHTWLAYGNNEDQIIEAIAEAAVPAAAVVETPAIEIERADRPFLGQIYTNQALKELIVVLLKILLTSCRGSIDPLSSPTNHPSFDLDRDYLLSVLEKEHVPLSESCIKKNYEIISSSISGLLLLLLRVTDQSQLQAIEKTIVSNNGCLVLLKIVTSYPADDSASSESIFPFLKDNKSWFLAVPPRLPNILFRSLKTLYALCRHNSGRIKKYLVHYKVAVVLKRFFTYPNVGIMKVAYKLFKIQIRYLSKKWKLMHIKLISCCYNATGLEPIDDYIVNDPDLLPEGTTEGCEDILNESGLVSSRHISERTQFDMEDYIKELSGMNFENEDEISAFCEKYSEPRSKFFGFGCRDYNEWLNLGLGLYVHYGNKYCTFTGIHMDETIRVDQG